MNITQRQINLAILALIAGTSLLGGIFAIIRGNQISTTIGAVGFLIFGGLWFAYWYGWDMARHVAVSFAVIIVGFGYREPFLTSELTLVFIIPPLLAHILTGPRWVLGSAFATLAIILVRAGGVGVYTDPTTLLFYTTIVGGMILGRLAHNNAQQLADANKRVTAALTQAEQQALANARQAQELTEQNEAQQRLLELVATLETPTVTMADGVLFAPIVGYVDSQRADRLISQLLDDASHQRARLVILDIAGVPTMDTATANTILHATAALRLLGCQVALTGISPEIAVTLTHLDVDLSTITTVPTPQEAVQRYTEQLHTSAQSNSPNEE